MTGERGVCRSDEKNENVQAKSVSLSVVRDPFVLRVGNVKDQLMLNGMT